MSNVVIMGAAGRDFHDFNVYYRDRPQDRVVAFTAAQIPNISGRRYPPELAGELYPDGIPIYPEEDLADLIERLDVSEVVFAYSDISYADLMHKASVVMAKGASFGLLGPRQTQLKSSRPVLAVCATRTGAGKSPLVRASVEVLKAWGKKPCVVRHPMPYGDLRQQACQRFATMDDLSSQACTIEEREEYEPHIRADTVVFAGVDYALILEAAEREADVIVWDGGNNDLPFFAPTLHIVVSDALRPGHELTYYPGEANARMANALVISKVDRADPEDVALIRRNLRALNPAAPISEAALALSVPSAEELRGQRALIIEDGPTITHGGMSSGAGLRAAEQFGAVPVDPRSFAVGGIRNAYGQYPHIGPVLPTLGYGQAQLEELSATINAVPCDVVIIASPVDLGRLVKITQPSYRVTYDFEVLHGPSLEEILAALRAERADE
jgi:predicted GTPase